MTRRNVDDILVKSMKRDLYTTSLKEAFEFMSKYNVRLNPTKCALKVKSRKFQGFIVSEQGMRSTSKNSRWLKR